MCTAFWSWADSQGFKMLLGPICIWCPSYVPLLILSPPLIGSTYKSCL